MWLWNNNVHNEAQNNLQETQKGCISLKYLYTGTLKTIKFLFGKNRKLMVLGVPIFNKVLKYWDT